MSAVFILLGTIATSSLGWEMTGRLSTAGQMTLELRCYRTRPGSDITFKARIRNGTSEPASVVVAYVGGNDIEYLAPGLVFRIKRPGSSEEESFRYRPQGDRSGGGTGRLDRRLVLLARGASFEWSIDGSQLLSLRSHKRFDASSERGEVFVVFNSSQSRPGEVPKLWDGRLESSAVQLPKDCKYGRNKPLQPTSGEDGGTDPR